MRTSSTNATAATSGKLTERVGFRISLEERIHCEKHGEVSKYIRLLIARDMNKENDNDIKIKIKEVLSEMMANGAIPALKSTSNTETKEIKQEKETKIIPKEEPTEKQVNDTFNLLNSVMNL